jgi:hypothetical protein
MSKRIEKIISNLKKVVKEKPTTLSDALTKALVHPAFRERDMRQEAKDMGAHGAKEIWGD